MAGESSRATPAVASRSAWSRRSSLRAWAASRRASAAVAALRAPWRSESAITPATTAAASSTPTPASSARRRRLVRRWRSASRSLAARLSSRKARSSSLSSRSWLGCPVERRGEPGAAVELGGIAPGALPLRGGLDQVLVKAPALGVLLEPGAKPRPLRKQRLVGDLDRALVHGHQPALGQHREGGGGVLVALGLELCERDPPSDRRRLLGVGEPQQDRPGALALGLGEAPVGALGEARHRAADAAARRVARLAQGATAALLPQLDQGGREQRQPAGLLRDVADERRDQRRLDPQPRRLRRELDRAAQLVAAHRPDQHGVGAHLRRQLLVLGAAAVEVAPDPEHDDAR